MKLAVYNEIIHLMHMYKSRDSLPVIAEKFPRFVCNLLRLTLKLTSVFKIECAERGTVT